MKMKLLMSKMVETATGGFYPLGIIETDFYPCSWYVGRIRFDGTQWEPSYNQTHYYYRSIEEAQVAYKMVVDSCTVFEGKEHE